MRCPRCYSENLIQIGHLVYCRDCIYFGQIRPTDKAKPEPVRFGDDTVTYELGYALSHEQIRIAHDVIKALNQGKHIAIQAVCGSGKTELVYPCICEALSQKKTVGFSVPRKDLAIEIYERLASQLKGVQMSLVYGGHHDDCYQPLVICTTHQLHRYWDFFDLLIIDEIDAYPFSKNHLLHQMAMSACKGQFVLLSATAFNGNLPKQFVKLELNRRYHGHDLPVPLLIWCPDRCFILMTFHRMKHIIANNGLCLVFVPLKSDAHLLKERFKRWGFKAEKVTSDCPDTQKIIEQFRQHQIEILVTTTLLERGVTFANVHVFVYRAHHLIFDTSTLTQIAGRVGRKPDYPDGGVYFLAHRITKEMRLCKKRILQKNAA